MNKASKGLKAGAYRSIGTTFDGVRILAPKTKPTHFTTREIRTAIDTVLRETDGTPDTKIDPHNRKKQASKAEHT